MKLECSSFLAWGFAQFLVIKSPSLCGSSSIMKDWLYIPFLFWKSKGVVTHIVNFMINNIFTGIFFEAWPSLISVKWVMCFKFNSLIHTNLEKPKRLEKYKYIAGQRLENISGQHISTLPNFSLSCYSMFQQTVVYSIWPFALRHPITTL